MTPTHAHTTRGLVAANVVRMMGASSLTLTALTERISRALPDWPADRASRIVRGKATVTLDDLLALSIGLGVDWTELVAGLGDVQVFGATLGVQDVFSYLATGRGDLFERVLDGDVDLMVLDPRGVGSPEQVDETAFRLWGLPFADELARRVAASERRFTGADESDTSTTGVEVSTRRRSGWISRHEREMVLELRGAMA